MPFIPLNTKDTIYNKISYNEANDYISSGHTVICGGGGETLTYWKKVADQVCCATDKDNQNWAYAIPTPEMMKAPWYIATTRREIMIDELENPQRRSTDMVNHPKHYHPGPYEVIKVLRAWCVTDFFLGNVIKYIARCGIKSPNQLEDLKKARFYLDEKIKELESK